MGNVTNLVFEWPAFIRAAVLSEADIDNHKLLIHTERGSFDGASWLLFRVWFTAPGGLTMFVGDVRVGPETVWKKAFCGVLLASELAVSKNLALQWAELPGGEDQCILPVLVTE